MPSSRRSRWLAFAALVIVYVLAAKLGLRFAVVHASATPLWPPTAIALAALVLGGAATRGDRRRDVRSPDRPHAGRPRPPGQHPGFALIRTLRAGERGGGPRVVAIALTAYAGEEDRRRVRDAGFDAHVAKPFDPAELARTIHALLPRG